VTALPPGEDYPRDSTADLSFERVARDAMDDLMRLDPVQATALGVHRFDSALPDRTEAGLADARESLAGWLAAVDSIDDVGLTPQNRVDHEILRAALAARLFGLEHLRSHTWDPLESNPGSALYLLLARDFAPLADRLRSLAGRLGTVPESLAAARASLGRMPRVHVETAISQFQGTVALVAEQVRAQLELEPGLAALVEPARVAAADALDDHVRWLQGQLPTADRDPRLGAELYSGQLWHVLDTEISADSVLVRAESDLMRIEAEIAELARGRDVRQVLDELADDGYVDDSSVLSICRRALTESTDFARAEALVTVPAGWDELVQIIEMPEVHRGVAVAYCDPPGPLEPAGLPSFFAVSPTPAGWPAARVRSFYREYNAHLLRNLTVHEAMPGHVLQLHRARDFVSGSSVRAGFWSGPFVEGWAVYVEEVMALAGFGGQAVRLQQLKMQLRTTINAILDVRVHAHGMTELEAMALMTGRGHQEVGEAAGKWRRAQLTSAQLSTYYVGYTEVSEVARAVQQAHPDWSARERHDAMLAHGSPPPRHLRALLGV
jgi:uncharacterized protein (DUF885 family)